MVLSLNVVVLRALCCLWSNTLIIKIRDGTDIFIDLVHFLLLQDWSAVYFRGLSSSLIFPWNQWEFLTQIKGSEWFITCETHIKLYFVPCWVVQMVEIMEYSSHTGRSAASDGEISMVHLCKYYLSRKERISQLVFCIFSFLNMSIFLCTSSILSVQCFQSALHSSLMLFSTWSFLKFFLTVF